MNYKRVSEKVYQRAVKQLAAQMVAMAREDCDKKCHRDYLMDTAEHYAATITEDVVAEITTIIYPKGATS